VHRLTTLFKLLLPGFALLSLVNCGGRHSGAEKYYLVAANIKVPYWQAAGAGLVKAAVEMKVQAEMVGPDTYNPKAEQEEFRRIMGGKPTPTGILVSAADAELMKPDIDAAIAQGIPVVTMDSDSPGSKRLLFIGTNNYQAGVMGGQVIAKQMGGKGDIAVFTMPNQANLIERLNGYRFVFSSYPKIKIAEIVDIKGDPRIAFDTTMNIIEKKKNIDGFIALEAQSGKEIADVLTRNNITGKTVVAMDTEQRTLEWIQKGVIAATIAQKPFTMGFYGVKVLDDLYHYPLKPLGANWAQDPFAPIPTFIDTGATLVDKSNVESFIKARNTATSGSNP
jgi:ribose transport system substrate-binding protein